MSIGKGAGGTSIVRSNGSDIFAFQSDPTEVDRIRGQVTWSDDFNGPIGNSDERHWNSAFTACSLIKTANYAFKGQKHGHKQLGELNPDCPSAQVTARARGVFNFTGRTGKVFADLDGGGNFPGRAQWNKVYVGTHTRNAAELDRAEHDHLRAAIRACEKNVQRKQALKLLSGNVADRV